MSLISNDAYVFDDFELQPSRRLLTREGTRVPLAPKAFDVLLYMVQNAGRVVLKEELLRNVWPDSFVEEGNLTQHIFWLRKALADKASYIVTIPGRGYEFVGKPQFVPDLAGASLEPAATEPKPAAKFGITVHHTTERLQVITEELAPAAALADAKPKTKLLLPLVVAAVCVCVAATWGWWRWAHRTIPGDHHEVVLADFENATGDPSFDRALKTLLIFDLSQSPFLSVASESDARKTLKLMKESPDAELTPKIAREVCERLNDQVVLAGTVANVGHKYLVTLVATDCTEGKDLITTKSVAPDRDGVIQAVDSVAADMRKRLGEPLRNMHAGQKLEAVHTNSLQALKLYGEARALHVRFKFQQAAALYEKAIEVDPNFASAYAQLANCYNNLNEQSKGEDAMAKAYALRDQTDDLDRMRITTMYEYWKYGDRHQAILNYRTWTEMFPRSAAGWDLLGEFEDSVGDRSAAIDAEKHAIEVNPMGVSQYVSLAQYELSAGRFEEVKNTAHQAFIHGVDLPDLHRILRDTALYQHDDAAAREQTDWLAKDGNPDDSEDAEADLDLSQGKIHAGLALKLHEIEAAQKDGRTQAALEKLAAVAATEADLGMLDKAREHLKSFHPMPPVNAEAFTNVIFAATETGDLEYADALLKKMIEKNPKDSDVLEFFTPEARASLAIARHQPDQAANDLSPALPYAHVYPGVFDLRGRAYLQAHKSEQAAADFREMVDHAPSLGLGEAEGVATVELARALAQSGNNVAARAEYAAFLKLWKDADPDIPFVVAARHENDALNPR